MPLAYYAIEKRTTSHITCIVFLPAPGSIMPIQRCISQVKSMTHWIKTSPKREGFLKVIAHEGIQIGIGATHTPILHYKNIDGWERFCLCHSFLIQLCEAIIHGTSEDKFSQHSSGWTQEDKNNALAHLKAIESFEVHIYTCDLAMLSSLSQGSFSKTAKHKSGYSFWA